jgi:hypothetical protein
VQESPPALSIKRLVLPAVLAAFKNDFLIRDSILRPRTSMPCHLRPARQGIQP